MISEPVMQGIDNLEIVVFQWSRNHGDCLECGLPAAFTTSYLHSVTKAQISRSLCAVCAANAAADGEKITWIEEPE